MKTNLFLAGALLAPGLMLSARAEEARSGFYSLADAGGVLTGETRLQEFPGAPGGGKVDFDPGVRLSLGGGWRFNQWIRAGGEFGFISHTIEGADASFAHFPLLASVEFQIPNRSPITPFFGAGPGVSISTVTFDDERLNGGDFVDGTAADAVFAWQAFGGLRYRLSDSMSLGAVYKYFSANETTWEVEGTSTDIRFGRTHSHSICVSFMMDF